MRTEPSAKLDQLAHEVVGAVIEVHRELGPGLGESVYEKALCHELAQRGLPYETQPRMSVFYKGIEVGNARPDLWVNRQLIIELKAVETLAPIHAAQLNTYLKITGCPLGLLFNFNVPTLKQGIKRIINTTP